MKKLFVAIFFAMSLSGCGAIQNYNQGLENNQRNFERQQALYDEQNTIEVNKLKAQQREQEIQASKAEGQKAQAQAAGDAQAAIEKAKGEAEANRILAQSLTPSLVRYRIALELVAQLGQSKSTVYLPSNVLPLGTLGLGDLSK